MTTRNPTIGGKGKPANDLPPSAEVAVSVPCAECGFQMPVLLRDGLNEKQWDCPRCAVRNTVLLKSDGHGGAIVFKGTVEMWVPD